jgi:hypothetical protein
MKANNGFSPPRFNAVFLGAVLFWSILIVPLAGWNYWQSYLATIEIVRTSAFESYSKDLVYRRWATFHGGVYVPITPNIPQPLSQAYPGKRCHHPFREEINLDESCLYDSSGP